MRLWSLHPKYLDPQGLVALWREALLAQAVLRGETKGYRKHPQLERFGKVDDPSAAISLYLRGVLDEAKSRGYSFNESKISATRKRIVLSVSTGQLHYEWSHLMTKLQRRSPAVHNRWKNVDPPKPHPLFRVHRGGVAPWERR